MKNIWRHYLLLSFFFLGWILVCCETTANTCLDDTSSLPSSTSEIEEEEDYFNNRCSNNNNAPYQWDPAGVHPCNIVQMTWKEVKSRFGPEGLPPMYPHPLVILADSSATTTTHNDQQHYRNAHFMALSRKETILDSFPPNFMVTLSSSNSFSEHRRTIPLEQYLHELEEQPQSFPHQRSNETWYLFGETYSDEWKQFLSNYQVPLCQACITEQQQPESGGVALSFGIGNRGSGVQWHVHGPGFSEAIVGRKHWVLYKDKPNFHKDQTSRNWMEYNYMSMTPKDRPYECTLDPGDVIYFPNMWWHATINLDPYTAFVSTFTQEHLFV